MGSAPTSAQQLLADAWDRWARRCGGLTAEEWAAPTRCGGWDVRALIAHVCPDQAMFDQLEAAVVAGPAKVTEPAHLLRMFNASGGVAHTAAADLAEHAVEEARDLSPSQAADRFARAAHRLRTESLAPDTVIAYPVAGTTTMAVVMDVALMEATVHLLDLAAAVGGVAPSDGALAASRAVLIAVADPVLAVEALAGRVLASAVLPVIR